jgi:hypothetical protein
MGCLKRLESRECSSEHSSLGITHFLQHLCTKQQRTALVAFKEVPNSCKQVASKLLQLAFTCQAFLFANWKFQNVLENVLHEQNSHFFSFLCTNQQRHKHMGCFLARVTQLFLSVKLQDISFYKYKHIARQKGKELTHTRILFFLSREYSKKCSSSS